MDQREHRVVQPIPSIERTLDKPARPDQRHGTPADPLDFDVLREQAPQLCPADVMMPHDPIRLVLVARLRATATDQRRNEREGPWQQNLTFADSRTLNRPSAGSVTMHRPRGTNTRDTSRMSSGRSSAGTCSRTLEAGHDIHTPVGQRDVGGGPVKDPDVRNLGEALPCRVEPDHTYADLGPPHQTPMRMVRSRAPGSAPRPRRGPGTVPERPKRRRGPS